MRCAWIGRPLSHRVGPGVCTQEDPGKGTVAGIVGWVLAHRRVLIAAYLVLLHGLVYFALTHGVFSAKEAPVCSPARCSQRPTDSNSTLACQHQDTWMPADLCITFGGANQRMFALGRHHSQRVSFAVH